jgi:virulence-associated protein VapD
MALYAIAFDLDTVAMNRDGLTAGQRTMIYQVEVPQALAACGFTAHAQGSLYHTAVEQEAIPALMTLQSTLRAQAPRFCRYVSTVHVFRMEEWSDVTALIADHQPVPHGADAAAPEEAGLNG